MSRFCWEDVLSPDRTVCSSLLWPPGEAFRHIINAAVDKQASGAEHVHEQESSQKDGVFFWGEFPPWPHQVSLLLVPPLSSLRVQLQSGELGGSLLQRLKHTHGQSQKKNYLQILSPLCSPATSKTCSINMFHSKYPTVLTNSDSATVNVLICQFFSLVFLTCDLS